MAEPGFLCAAGSPSLGRDQAEEPGTDVALRPDSENTQGVGIIICREAVTTTGDQEQGHDVAARLSHEGYMPVLRYSTGMYGNAYPVMMEDIQRAFMLVKENAAAYRINPTV